MTVDELKVMKDNECILFVRGIYPFFCDKFVIEKHLNYKLLEDSNKDNAYLLSDVNTVKFGFGNEQENEDLHSEPTEDSENSSGEVVTEQSYKKLSSEDVPNIEFEQSVTIEEIIGCQAHTYIVPKDIPKSPKGGGTEPAELESSDIMVTAEPQLKPPFTEVKEEAYLDVFDEIEIYGGF
jgi:type IV secretion system protein VirD4